MIRQIALWVGRGKSSIGILHNPAPKYYVLCIKNIRLYGYISPRCTGVAGLALAVGLYRVHIDFTDLAYRTMSLSGLA